MDRISDSGSDDRRSIRLGGTIFGLADTCKAFFVKIGLNFGLKVQIFRIRTSSIEGADPLKLP